MRENSRIEAITVDFYNTLVFHREGRGRGSVLLDYLQEQRFEPVGWEHQVLYDVFEFHDRAYSPAAPREAKERYYIDLAVRLFERLDLQFPGEEASRHAEPLWRILGPASLELFPDVVRALGGLRSLGLPLAIVSNWQRGLGNFCEELGIAGYFQHILASAEVGMEKPDPRIFHEACRRLGTTPERTLHVGDTFIDDRLGAEAAGLRVMLIERRSGGQRAPTGVIHDLADLPRLVGGNDAWE